MLQFLSNAFNDPSDPWYYVIGVIFLLLVFGALALYIFWGNKKKKQDESDIQDADKEAPAKDEVTDSSDTAAESQQDKE